jgi:hypothetical protein
MFGKGRWRRSKGFSASRNSSMAAIELLSVFAMLSWYSAAARAQISGLFDPCSCAGSRLVQSFAESGRSSVFGLGSKGVRVGSAKNMIRPAFSPTSSITAFCPVVTFSTCTSSFHHHRIKLCCTQGSRHPPPWPLMRKSSRLRPSTQSPTTPSPMALPG